MGYDAHITRAEFWCDNAGNEITAEEWRAVVEGDADLKPWPEQGPHMARWLGPSTLTDPWLDWREGNVFTKNPDAALLAKCCGIAVRLGARVQGDDGEEYVAGADGVARPAGASGPVPDDPRPWWRRWLG